jgi:hypothetical protein
MNDPHCFLILPFQDPLIRAARQEGIDPAASRYGFRSVRVDETPGPTTITAATHESIESADFVIADLTGARPNCYYEVGYAQALQRPVIFLIRRPEQPHFNVAGFPFIEYETPQDLHDQLDVHIVNQVLISHARGGDPGDNVGQFGRRSFVDPYVVTGRVRPNITEGQKRNRSYFVDLLLRSVDPQRPLHGVVTFSLHKDWGANRRQKMPVYDGRAEFTIPTSGAFTVGIVLKESGVKLEIDLSRLHARVSCLVTGMDPVDSSARTAIICVVASHAKSTSTINRPLTHSVGHGRRSTAHAGDHCLLALHLGLGHGRSHGVSNFSAPT